MKSDNIALNETLSANSENTSEPSALEVAENAPYDYICRIMFSKTGSAAYISHLDLVRTMTRAIRRARLPIWYTEGFNRHPYLTFAAPLSLGFEGLRESMDLRFIKKISHERVTDELNKVLPDGLRVIGVGEPILKAKELTAALYEVEITPKGGEIFEDDFRRFQALDEITAKKLTKKKKLKEIPLKAFVDKAELLKSDSGSVKFKIMLPCGGSENINPNLVVGEFLSFMKVEDLMTAGVKIVRFNLFAGDRVFE